MITLLLLILSDPLTARVAELSHRQPDDVRPYVEAARIAERETGVCARLLLAIAIVETRAGAALIGDHGRACGAWQYHARYSPAAEFLGVDGVCELLQREPVEAALHAADYLLGYDLRVCHYQAGHTCSHGRYVARVERVLRRLTPTTGDEQ
jgi:hypothetical protein